MGTPPWSLQQKQKQGFQFENPFSLKVGQIFTGVGVGCGVGIGIGNPIYFGAIPALQQVMVATRGATDIFSGVGRHVHASMKKLGLTNVQAGVGCGVGIGHGFGVGLALKPGVVRGIQSSFEELVAKIMTKMKDVPGLSSSESTIQGAAQEQGTPPSMNAIKSTTSVVKDSTGMSYEKRTGVISELTGSRTDKTGNLRSENNMLQMLLKHQQVIEELREENEKLREILIEDLKVSPHRLRGYSKNKKSSYAYETPCSDCFECRRRTRKAPR
ncbi:dynamin isoform X2 [Carex rostrata]